MTTILQETVMWNNHYRIETNFWLPQGAKNSPTSFLILADPLFRLLNFWKNEAIVFVDDISAYVGDDENLHKVIKIID